MSNSEFAFKRFPKMFSAIFYPLCGGLPSLHHCLQIHTSISKNFRIRPSAPLWI